MSISSTNRKAGPYSGNGSTVAFPFAFKVFTAADVRVVLTNANSKVESDLVLGTNYSVTINSDQDANPGGTVTTTTAYAFGYFVTLTSAVKNLQPVTLTNNGGFYPKIINDALDRVTILVQQLAEQVSRAVKVGISSTTSPDQLISSLFSASTSAATSATAAADSASAASTLAANAAISATVAASSSSGAVASATNAAGSAAAAASSASGASTSATNSANSASAASTSATTATNQAAAAAASALQAGSVSGLSAFAAANWTAYYTSKTTQYGIFKSAYGNGIHVVVEPLSGNHLTSPNGEDWTVRTVSLNGNCTGLYFCNGIFVAFYSFGSSSYVHTSTDGINWTQRLSTTFSPTSVAFGGGIYVATAAGSNRYLTSTDGVTWTERTFPSQNFGFVAFGGSVFVSVGGDGVSYTSTDGINWTSRASYSGYKPFSICFGNNKFVASYFDNTTNFVGFMATSSDGITWQTASISSTGVSAFYSLAGSGGVFVGTPNNPSLGLLTSLDGLTWSKKYIPSSFSPLGGVVLGNGYFMVAGYRASDQTIAFLRSLRWV